MRFTHHIETVQINPFNSRELKIKQVLENNFIHAKRKQLDGDIVLTGADYDYVKTLETTRKDDKFAFKSNNNGIVDFEGEFTIYDGSFDDYKKTCSINVTPRDAYTAIQENEDIEVNLIDTRKEISMDRYSRWYFFLTRTTGETGSDTTTEKIVNTVSVSLFGIYVNLMVTELLDLDKWTTAPSGWELFEDLGDIITYKRYPVNFNLTFTFDGLGTADISDYKWSGLLTYTPPFDETIHNLIKLSYGTSGEDTDYSLLWIKKSVYNNRANYVMTQTYSGRGLKDSLNRIISVAFPDFTGTIKSSLLFKDPVESGNDVDYSDMWDFYYEKYLIEMSDFRKPNALEPATKIIITWKQLSEALCLKHNMKWFIDINGDLRFEHISYFNTSAIAVDLSADPNISRKYNYIQNDKPNWEFTSEASAWNEDFEQIETLYGSVPALSGAKENTKSRSITTLYTDVDGLNSHLDELSDSGFVYVDGSTVVKGTGFKSGEADLQNVYLSNANCLNTYYRHDAYQDEFSIGGVNVVALSRKKLKKHSIFFEEVPGEGNIMTWLGAGQVQELSYKLVDEYSFNAELLYE